MLNQRAKELIQEAIELLSVASISQSAIDNATNLIKTACESIKNEKEENKEEDVNVNINEVPYISTYYIKPIVEIGEEAKLDFYITDYFHKEYLEDDYSETFTVTLRIEGREDKKFYNLKAGDHTISLGKFDTEGEKKFSILCTDKYGRNSHELFNFILVRNTVEVKEYIMTQEDLVKYNIKNTDDYEVIEFSEGTLKDLFKSAPSGKYLCLLPTNDSGTYDYSKFKNITVKYGNGYDKEAVLQESTNTRIGLQQLLDDKKAEGYNKVVLLNGKYRIDHQSPIYIPNEMTLDMNGATLKLNQFTGCKSLMVDINDTFDSHVINGTIEGDYFAHDYANSEKNSEWVNGISITSGAKYSSFENIFIKNITGYGSGNGIGVTRDGIYYTYIYPKGIGDNFKLCDIDRNTGEEISSEVRSTCNMIQIDKKYASEVGYLSISRYLGYQGNDCGSWNLICHFYDGNKKFIKSVDGFQYRRIAVPQGAEYIRVTLLCDTLPTTLSIHLFRIPTHCAFKNVKHENVRCVGMAQSAMNDMLVENCEFTKCGYSGAFCAYDAEDGWDAMQDVTFKGLKFYGNGRNDFLTCAGHNFMIDGQVQGNIHIWERTRGLVVRNCNCGSINLGSGGIENIVRHGIYRVYNNEFKEGIVENNLVKNITCKTEGQGLRGRVDNSTLNKFGGTKSNYYTNCIMNIDNAFLNYLSNQTAIDCDFKPVDGFNDRYSLSFNNKEGKFYFENCNFFGKSLLSNHNEFHSGHFVNCHFDNTSIQANVQSKEDDVILFENCEIGYEEENLVRYSPFAYTDGTHSEVVFKDCTITNKSAKSLLYAYSKPVGKVVFENCIIDVPKDTILFDGYANDSNINIDIELINTTIVNELKLTHDKFKDNENIRIIIK